MWLPLGFFLKPTQRAFLPRKTRPFVQLARMPETLTTGPGQFQSVKKENRSQSPALKA